MNTIVKVQIPIYSSDDNAPAMYYNKERDIHGELPISETLLSLMEGKLKKYFNAKYDGRTIALLDAVDDQPW